MWRDFWHDVRITWEFWRMRHMRRDLRKRPQPDLPYPFGNGPFI